MVKEIPVFMMKPMVRAILEGKKHKTRRPIKPQPSIDLEIGDGWLYSEKVKCRYGSIHDILRVREPQLIIEIDNHTKPIMIRVRYEADNTESEWIEWPTRLANFPLQNNRLAYGGFRESARLYLRNVEDPHIERLQDITEDEARDEGVEIDDDDHLYKDSFIRLWDKMYKKQPTLQWHNNPLLWRLNFTKVNGGIR